MYGAQLAAIYDQIYQSRGKDYAEEAKFVTASIRERTPRAASLLDVGCGTGAHLARFRTAFDRVEGLELAEDMLRIAGDRLPGIVLHQGDMRSFDLGRQFDAVVCLFGSVGHVETCEELEATMACFARHLTPGGVLALEPWWFSENYLDDYVSGDVITVEGRTIARVSHTRRDGAGSRMEVHYVVADAEAGIQHFTEAYGHRLFSRDEYTRALENCGFRIEYVPAVLGNRGLFLGIRP